MYIIFNLEEFVIEYKKELSYWIQEVKWWNDYRQ